MTIALFLRTFPYVLLRVAVYLPFGLALLFANVVRWVLVDPMATVAMIVSYNQAIKDQAPSYDLWAQLTSVSRGFRQMVEWSGGGPRARAAV